jgi:hypothetical protein
MADINVTITVDTASITPQNLSTTVVLTDNQGDTDDTPGDSTTFDIHASAGQTVAFTIISIDGTMVNLVSLAQESGVVAFSELPSSSNSFVGSVSETVIGEEAFSITFNVVGNTNSPFTLDPKLKAGQG